MCKIIGFSVQIFLLTFICTVCSQSLQIEERLVSYQKCLLDSDCHENSFCFENDFNRIGRCKCQKGFELLSRNRTYYACLQLAGWEEPCVQDNQCYDRLGTFAVCDETCKCGEGSHRYNDGLCYKSILLTDYCQVDANCLLKDGTYGYCIDGKCDCYNLLFRPTEDKLNCIASRNIGDSCASDEECSLIQNTVCRLVCRCAPGYVLSRSGRNCLKAATKFFESCDEDDQCSEYLKGSFCNNGNCTCNEGFHGFGTVCTRSVGLMEACSSIEECIPELQFSNVINCTEGVCQCQPGAVSETFGCNSSQRVIANFSLYFLLYLIFYRLLL